MRLVLLGPPGSGKGTQAKFLEQGYGLKHLSTGELLRLAISEQTKLGNAVADIINSGQLVSDDLIIELVSDRIDKLDGEAAFVLDGCPRTKGQAEALEVMLSEKNQNLDLVVQMAVDNDQIVKRISGRINCTNCGASYHSEFNKPKIDNVCDFCGGHSFERRADDSEVSVRRRLDVYEQETAPLAKFYENKGILQTIDAMAPVGEVSIELGALIANHMS
ncbi:MAG: adenylate kinase [Alphaproteobacteria bacterium]